MTSYHEYNKFNKGRVLVDDMDFGDIKSYLSVK